LGKGAERFFTYLGRFLIGHGHDATGAEFYPFELNGPNLKKAQGVFQIGVSTCKYNIGPEAVHGQRFCKVGIQIIEGGLPYQ
jgi:hypothetical protein